ncbi:MAG TPA: hypothetical protein VFM94_03550 [Solirubrobacterales bacterium]|nr:hypothetical protein [Solirubrobacterales bacterium]
MIPYDSAYLSHAPSELKDLVKDLRLQRERNGETIPDPVWTVGRIDPPEGDAAGEVDSPGDAGDEEHVPDVPDE